MSKFFVIDRFDGKYAVLECGESVFDVPIGIIPEGVKEGDTIEIRISRHFKNERKYDDLFEK